MEEEYSNLYQCQVLIGREYCEDWEEYEHTCVWADKYRDMRKLVENFLDKYDICEPHINSAFAFMQNHCGPYSGPQFGKELEELRDATRQ